MANPGYIIVKGKAGTDGRHTENRRTYKQFYGEVDKGSNKPSFCYPRRKLDLEEETRSMERALELQQVAGDRRLQFEASLKKKKDRLDAINQSHEDAKNLLDEHKDQWVARRKELGDEISAATPTRQAVKDRHVNPYSILKTEKGGLGEKKKEYQVLSRLLDEESNVGFLQREK